jgi:hypothetical protein
MSYREIYTITFFDAPWAQVGILDAVMSPCGILLLLDGSLCSCEVQKAFLPQVDKTA